MRIGEKLISNTFYMFLDWIFLVIFSFIFWFSLGKTLSREELGAVSTLTSFIMLLSWISLFGVGLALQKLIPEFQRKNSKKLYSLIRISLNPVIVVTGITLLILLIFSNQLSAILKVPRIGIFISIFSIFAIVPYGFFGSVIYGFQNMKKYFLTDLLQVLLRVLIAVPLIILGFRLYGPLVGFGLGYFIALFLRIDLKYFKNKNSQFSYKELFYYASPAFISTVASNVISNSQYIILTILKTTAITGIFTIAFLLTSVLGIMVSVLTSALFPIISSLSVNHKMKRRQGYLIALVLRYSLIIIIPLSAIFLIFSRWIILSFSSIEYISASDYFPILIPAAILSGIGGIFNNNLYAIGKPKISRNILVVTSLLFLTLSILAVQSFSALGLSFAYLTSMLFYFTLNLIYIRKFLMINFFIADILKILLSSIFIGLLLLFLYPFVYNIIIVVIASLASMIFYLFLLLFLKFYRAEDIKILEYFSKRIPQLNKYLSAVVDLLKKFQNE
jgi:putative peptidoglycan lipid II flippase